MSFSGTLSITASSSFYMDFPVVNIVKNLGHKNTVP